MVVAILSEPQQDAGVAARLPPKRQEEDGPELFFVARQQPAHLLSRSDLALFSPPTVFPRRLSAPLLSSSSIALYRCNGFRCRQAC